MKKGVKRKANMRVTELLLDTIIPSDYVEGREGQKKARGEHFFITNELIFYMYMLVLYITGGAI